MNRQLPGNIPPCLRYRAVAIALLLVGSLLLLPAVASSPGAPDPSPLAGAEESLHPPSAAARITPAPVITGRPEPLPARQNRTSIQQQAEKAAAERPKVVVPVWWFIAVVVFLFAALGAILYLLLRRGAGTAQSKPSPMEKPLSKVGSATVIDATAAPLPVQGSGPGLHGPAVQFPPSLGKRFVDPEFIGEGGLARVFRATNAKNGRTVAVKVPTRFDEVTGTHFSRDIVLWQGLSHPNIIRIYSSNILPVPYIEMEYAPSSLASARLPMPEDAAVKMALGIARGLAYAHGQGIVHRDIKPENILLAADGTPRITDWGLGKAIGDPRQSSIVGFSPAYAAPEQIAPHRFGRAGQATDIYQLGMLLYEMLTGSPAFRGEGLFDLNVAILDKVPGIPSWNGRHQEILRRIIIRCLEKKPEDRYVSVEDLIRDLEPLQDK